MGRDPPVTEDRGNAPSISPAPSGPRSLLGSKTWSSALKGQRHSWAPPAALNLSPTPYLPRAFSGPMGPKHRPRPPPKPRPCLNLAPHRQGLFWLFFFFSPLLCYCSSVLPSSCCFIYMFIFIFFITYLLVS